MNKITSIIVFVYVLLECAASIQAKLWAGANSAFLFAYQTSDRQEILDSIKGLGMKVVRIHVSEVFANIKNSGNDGIGDLEPITVGTYDDAILNRIDVLMYEAFTRGLKLNIALHDRYRLGCKGSDRYVDKYGIPQTSSPTACPTGNDVRAFYTNPDAAADLDNRFAHILTHRNPYFANRTWGELSEAVFAFDIQNEPQSYSSGNKVGSAPANPGWTCARATALRPLANGTLLTSGGGYSMDDSLLAQNFDCAALDIIAIHSYENEYATKLPGAVSTARAKQKRIMVQEFGLSSQKAGLGILISGIVNRQVPWMVTQIVKPNNADDYDIYNTDTSTWSLLKTKAMATNDMASVSAWPEVNGLKDTASAAPPSIKAAAPALQWWWAWCALWALWIWWE